MRFLVTLFILMVCTAAVHSTRRVPPRNCNYYVKATFGRIFTEMNAIKEKITDMQSENNDQQEEVTMLQEKVEDLERENSDLQMKSNDQQEEVTMLQEKVEDLEMKVDDLEVDNSDLKLKVSDLEQKVNQTDPASAFAIYGATPTEDPSTETLVFPQYRLNIGDHYNTSTGMYTCQYPGIYVFSVHIYKKDEDISDVACFIRLNGIDQVHVTVPGTSNDGFYEGSTSTVFHLQEGDTVDIGNCLDPSAISQLTSVIGFLLYAD